MMSFIVIEKIFLLKCVLLFSFAHLWGGVGSLLQTIEMLCVIYQHTDCLKI